MYCQNLKASCSWCLFPIFQAYATASHDHVDTNSSDDDSSGESENSGAENNSGGHSLDKAESNLMGNHCIVKKKKDQSHYNRENGDKETNAVVANILSGDCYYIIQNQAYLLTHWGLDQIAASLQMTFWNWFPRWTL